MFNKQLRNNIKALDLQISELSKEIRELKQTNKYDVKKRTLEDLIELRDKITKGLGEDQTSKAVDELNRQIEEIAMELVKLELDEVYLDKMNRLNDLTKIRYQLSEVKVKESNAPIIISGVVSISAIALIMKYEEANIITTKAFGIATKMFRG
jgi:predicted RNase H-like nuclease (RuvC/YqgF family)